MKIELELPNGTVGVSITYICVNNAGVELGTKVFDSDRMKELIVDSETIVDSESGEDNAEIH